jgi:hypothetical protein
MPYVVQGMYSVIQVLANVSTNQILIIVKMKKYIMIMILSMYKICYFILTCTLYVLLPRLVCTKYVLSSMRSV